MAEWIDVSIDPMKSEASDLDDAPRSRRKGKACRLEGCRSRHYAKNYCKKHYTQVLRHGRLTPERERGVIRVCKAAGCNETDTIRYYCRKHARQIRVHGRLTPDREHNMNNEGCSIDVCSGGHRAKGLCAKHYNQQRWQRIKGQRPGGSASSSSNPTGKGVYTSAAKPPNPHVQAFIEPFSPSPRNVLRSSAS